jgi:hypothetical protein
MPILSCCHHPSLEITTIYLELWVYQRKDTATETVTSYTPFLHVTTPSSLKKKMKEWFQNAVQESYHLTPANLGQVMHA